MQAGRRVAPAAQADYHLRTLQELTVRTVYGNGLSGNFRQVAYEVRDEQGAREGRAYTMQYDPLSQRFAVSSGQPGANGNFTMTMGAYSGPVLLQVRGGSYLDEATGVRMNMLGADELTCVVPAVTVTAGSTTAGVQVTPLTTMAQAWAEHMAGGMTTAGDLRRGCTFL